ncbi:hypothetical protein L915_08262 [Phytophthora nicotianae]|uniref:Uncharacterized protein n=1 Tax=Phytophthora nicotianae TaxID=4792 RepID=W2GY69_PHYNI|nr:hypothetical protein L915_08262 [Phytophthora nicotianae]
MGPEILAKFSPLACKSRKGISQLLRLHSREDKYP